MCRVHLVEQAVINEKGIGYSHGVCATVVPGGPVLTGQSLLQLTVCLVFPFLLQEDV